MSTSTPVSSAAAAASAVRARARTALGKTFQSLSAYNFRLFFVGQLISNTGNQLTNVALILFVLKLGHSGLAVGALAACQLGPLVALSAWAGAVADRSDKRRVCLAFDNPLRRSFVPEMVSKDDLPNAVVLYSTIVALSQVSGPALAGALVTTAGFGWCFALDAITY